MCKVRDLSNGKILWYGCACLGIKGSTLPDMFDECTCCKVSGNCFDWELVGNKTFTKEQQDFINEALAYWSEDE